MLELSADRRVAPLAVGVAHLGDALLRTVERRLGAFCDTLDALPTTGSCAFAIAPAASEGATTYPTRQPVIAYDFENVKTVTTRSGSADGRGAACSPSKTSSS